jgi:5'-nucleotidase/UDP-sugar diphosphatase
MRCYRSLLAAVFAIALLPALADETITILHTNDVHARVEPASIKGRLYGGYARLATLIRKYEASDPHPLVVNAGDTFQGTLYFNVYEGLADAALMDYIGFRAMAVGNHEFDRGPAVLAAFAKEIAFPLLSANLDVSGEPALKGLIKPLAVVDADGVKVGLIGATTEDLPTISSPGPNVKVNAVVPAVQAAVDRLTAQGVDKIVLLSHCGYDVDIAMASMLRGVDVIVGGHSHTPLGTLDVPGFPASAGPYPTVVKGADGKTVLIVQAWEWGKVLGRIRVTFDDAGAVRSYSDAASVPVDDTIAEDPVAKAMIAAFQRPIAAFQNEPVGSSSVDLTMNLMANLITDAMLDATRKMGAVAAFVNAGGVRSELEAGELTFGELISVQPFSNTLVVMELTGTELAAALQHGVESGGGMLLPSAGTSYRVVDGKVTDIRVADAPLDPARTYTVTINSFTAAGGDAHTVLRDAKGRRTDTGLRDIDVLVDYVKAHSPLSPKSEARVRS